MRNAEFESKQRNCEFGLRVALVTETYPPEVNGVALTLQKVLHGLIERGHDVHLVRPRQAASEIAAKGPLFEETLVKGWRLPRYEELRFGLPSRRLLIDAWSRRRPDLVHVATEGPLGWSAVSVARHLRIPVTSDLRTNFDHYSEHYGFGWLRGAVAGYLRRFHNRTALTFVPTLEQAEALRRCGYRKVDVIARGVDGNLFSSHKRTEALRREWGVGPSDLAVIHVGRLAAEKNLTLLLRAFSTIRRNNPTAKLVLVGDGPMRASLYRDFPEIVFAGMRKGDELAMHYASADLFLFPSLTETFGNVVLEAMASGLPVLAYDYAAASEAICSGANGVTVPRDDETMFIEQTLQLANNPTLRRQLGLRARTSCVECFTWDKVNDRFEAALMEVVRTSDNTPPQASGSAQRGG